MASHSTPLGALAPSKGPQIGGKAPGGVARNYLALLAGLVMAGTMLAGLFAGNDSPGQPLMDSNVAVAYSQEYGLVFNAALGGPDHIPQALALLHELRTSVQAEKPDAAALLALLDLQETILVAEAYLPGGPDGALAELLGAGGGLRLRSELVEGVGEAEDQIGLAQALADVATGRARSGLGFAPNAAGIVKHWQGRLDGWLDVASQVQEASAPYASFFSGPAAPSLDEALARVAATSHAEGYQLFSVSERVHRGLAATTADATGYLLSTATHLGLPAELIVGLDSNASISYCARIDGQRHCPGPAVIELAAVSKPAPGLGVVSATVADTDVATEGGRLGLFNDRGRATGNLDIVVHALDGSWNATANLGPVPPDGARFAYFDVLGEGPAWVEVHDESTLMLRWLGESTPGYGLVLG